ncbi:DUF5642 family protein [uncultured Tessaracoccus sp.]|uniref:DUF5642 family protein n=1 Tax=uncultured Tessaracoccus sp. TaxID=905023 RepID=UPI00261AA745|nr:DUF5642 family protein [uncultured Tessaracoccus sp.]
MKLKLVGATLVALALSLTGCGKDGGGEPVPSEPAASATEQSTSDNPVEPATPSEQPSKDTPGGEETPGNEETPGGGTGAKPAELDDRGRAVIEDFMAKHKNAETIPPEMFNVEEGRKALSEMEVKPAECNAMMGAQFNPELLNSAAWGGATTVDPASGGHISLAVAQLAEEARPLVENVRAMSEKCPQFTMGEGEQKVTATVKLYDAPSVQGADAAHIIENTVEIGGQKQMLYIGYVARGNMLVNVIVPAKESSASPSSAEKLLAEAVAAAQ